LYRPSIDFLRRGLHPAVDGCSVEALKSGLRATGVYRLRLSRRAEGAAPPSVVAKAAPLGDDAALAHEQRVYDDLLPRLGIPQARALFSGVDAQAGWRVLLLEDLAPRHRFEAHDHLWSPAEMRCLLRAYARLHVRGAPFAADAAPWLPAPAAAPSPAEAERLADELAGLGLLRPLPGLGRRVEEAQAGVLDSRPGTVLHNDAYPPNTAMPADLTGDAVLVDWEMAGRGPAEFDLAYLFLLPFGNARGLGRAEALACYWAERAALGDAVPPAGAREAAQRQADARVALSFLPLARRAATAPYPTGTPARAYWDAMFPALDARLSGFCQQS
jgi:hypothetical protein